MFELKPALRRLGLLTMLLGAAGGAAGILAGIAAGQGRPAVDATAGPHGEDGESVESSDPLAWVGDRDIRFIARVKGTGAELRSGPDPAYRVLRTAEEGELLIVVGDAAKHVEVLVPAGFAAYVHGRYVDLGPNDIGVVNTTRVNIRSRPTSTGDYPIGKVHTGRELQVWGKAESDPDWYRVVAPSEFTLFVSDDEVEIAGDEHDPGLQDEIAAAREDRLAAFERRSPEAILRREARERAEQAPARLEEALALFQEERSLGLEADFSPAEERLAQVLADSTDPMLKTRATALKSQIALQERLNEAEREKQALREELEREREQILEERRRFQEQLEAAKAASESQVAEVAPGEAGEWNGFLRLQPGGSAHPIGLEQGQQMQAWLYCSSGKLRLRDYVGLQVQVSGRALRLEGAPVVDVDHLTILKR